MRTKPFLVFGILLAGAIASAQTPLLPAPHRHVTTVSPAEVRANEPSIAVNPNNPNQVVAAFQPAGIAYSTDGGQTFGFGRSARNRGLARREDPANRKTAVTLARSTDGGKTFVNYAWEETPFETPRTTFLGDYTWLVAHQRKVYGVWTEALPTTRTEQSTGQPARPATAVRVGFADFLASSSQWIGVETATSSFE